MPQYQKTVWQDSENRYDILQQDGSVVHPDVKVVGKGAVGTALSAANLNKLEGQYEAVVGTGDTDVIPIKSLFIAVDTRKQVATTWDSDDRPTSIEVRQPDETVIATITIAYNGDGRITSLTITEGSVIATYTVNWDGVKFLSLSKVVA